MRGAPGAPSFYLKQRLMILRKYVKKGQKIQLRALNSRPPEGKQELLSATLASGEDDHLVLRLPYGPNTVQEYPIVRGMPFELSADAMGLGIKVSVAVTDILSGEEIRVRAEDDLQMFQRRAQPRVDCTLALRLTRHGGSLQNLRQAWQQNVAIFADSHGVTSLEGFDSCQLNLSSGGMRLLIQPPAAPDEVCLVLLALPDRKPPVCALAETVWVSDPNPEEFVYAGMRFINILEEDQKRIDRFVREFS